MKIIIKRKISSFIKKVNIKCTSLINKIKIFLLEENIKIEKNVVLGKNVKIKTSDNGKIIIKEFSIIEEDCVIYAQNSEIIIGHNTFIGKGTQIISKKKIEIGNDCLIASYCVIRDANHCIDKNKKIYEQGFCIKPIKIEDDVWLGTHVVITKGVHLKTGVIVGANSVVTKNVDEYVVVGGVPAKYIKKRI